ncbi:solute carrier organic anion transporter family member 4C1-like isoform X2 [Coccinella septempunctata]|uniref:solute carrier organic anion transporter family member 4C1-like isoform X2 n=1 Tax=Coccinella septempunctata TaxID=41139 RepID=UPI001D0604B2|nr:solute carrier organic anion transporter family member 4C1-like isoform X2 [Coccinella septempunctata]
MIHPSDLLRSDSRSKQFTAPLNLQGQSDNDWGIYIFPCLAKLFNWKTFARPWLFTTILSLIGFVQGFLLFYFRNTSEIWSRQYGISKGTTEWIIYVNEFFIGLVALPISYWASITHKIKWISLITFCHGTFSIFMFIPERIFAKAMIVPNSSVLLCGDGYQKTHEDTNLAALSYIIIYQLLGATASVAFYSLGLVYMNDNIIRNKPTILAIALASKLSGQQFGVYAAWLPNWFNNSLIFKSFVWQSCCVFYLLLTVGIAMFPKVLPSLLIKKLAASLLEIASGISTSEEVMPQEDGFFSTIRRIVRNRIILLSIVSAVAMESALINFDIFENYFKQSRFFISDNFDNFGFTSSFSLNFLANIMEEPLTISCLIIAGLVISRKKAKVKYLILWNIAIYSVASILFVGNLFTKCEYEDISQLVPSCSVDCNCTLDETFNPVCLKGRTYYSPCHAGCRTIERLEEYQIYRNCTCGSFEGTATEGSCHFYSCGFQYQMWQMNNIVIRGLLATTVITNIVIVLSIVRVTDQSVTLGLEMSLLSLVPFLPVKWVYHIVAEKLCRHWYLGKCRIYSPQLSSFIFNATILLMLIGTVTQMILLATKMDGPEKPSRIRKNRKNSDISSKRAASVHLETDASESSDYFDGDQDSQHLDLTEDTRDTDNSIIMHNPKSIETHL